MINIRSVQLFHEVFGDHGPWMALNTGGRRSSEEMAPLAKLIAAQGFRVLIHDRRNTGRSSIVIDDMGGLSEEEIWADDLHALMQHYNALPAFFCGTSAGARLCMLVKRRHPDAVKGLLLARVTGGEFAAGRLPNMYYGQFIKAAQEGGMAAVCATDTYRDRLASNPVNRDYMMGLSAAHYIDVMTRWRTAFTSGPKGPVMGIPEAELAAYKLPVIVVPGNDKTHASVNGQACAALIPNSELFELPIQDQDVDLISFTAWAEHYSAMAEKFSAFMRKHS